MTSLTSISLLHSCISQQGSDTCKIGVRSGSGRGCFGMARPSLPRPHPDKTISFTESIIALSFYFIFLFSLLLVPSWYFMVFQPNNSLPLPLLTPLLLTPLCSLSLSLPCSLRTHASHNRKHGVGGDEAEQSSARLRSTFRRRRAERGRGLGLS